MLKHSTDLEMLFDRITTIIHEFLLLCFMIYFRVQYAFGSAQFWVNLHIFPRVIIRCFHEGLDFDLKFGHQCADIFN